MSRIFSVSLIVLLFLAVPCAAQNPFLSSQPGYPTWSPFEDVKWNGDAPTVRVKGAWYTPISVHGVKVENAPNVQILGVESAIGAVQDLLRAWERQQDYGQDEYKQDHTEHRVGG